MWPIFPKRVRLALDILAFFFVDVFIFLLGNSCLNLFIITTAGVSALWRT